jgi:hypothetical protein
MNSILWSTYLHTRENIRGRRYFGVRIFENPCTKMQRTFTLLLHIHDKPSRNAILLLVQEVKRDLIYRRMNLPPSALQITDARRLVAHLDSTIRRLHSYLQYIGLLKYKKAAEMLLRLRELMLAWGVLNGIPCFRSPIFFPIPCQHWHMCKHRTLSTLSIGSSTSM